MRTVRLRWPYLLLLQQPAVASTSRGCPEVNKFEQVSSDGRQMPLTEGGPEVPWGGVQTMYSNVKVEQVWTTLGVKPELEGPCMVRGVPFWWGITEAGTMYGG